MNYDRPTNKQKNLSRQERCARKPKRKTNNEQAASFLLCEKMLDLMMEIFRPFWEIELTLQGQQGIPCRCLLYACQWVALDGLAHRTRQARGVGSKFNHWAKRGVRAELFEQLKQRVKDANLECIMADSAAVKNHKSAGAKGGNQCIGKTDNGPATKIRMIVDGAETRPASPSQRAMSAIQRRPSV